MNHAKIRLACLLTGLFFAKAGFSQSEIRQEIYPETTNQDIRTLTSDLREQGVILDVKKIKRRRGDIKKISFTVHSGQGSVKYASCDFSGIIIERNKTVAIGVSAIPQ